MFEMLNNSKVIYVEDAGAIPKMALWYSEDDTVFNVVCDEVWVGQIAVSDFNPKFSFAVTFLSKYLRKPGIKHVQAAKHKLRYLQGAKSLGIGYTRDLNRLRNRGQDLNVIYGLSDSDFAGCKDTAKSTSGHLVLLNGGPIAYHSGRQTTVALCTAMAETIALAKLVVKIKYLGALLHDLNVLSDAGN